MSDLVRFGVAMDRDLLRRFDERTAARGYENRSEALRDLVRADLTRAAWEGDVPVTGTLTIVVARRHREHVARALEETAERGVLVASMHVPLDGDRALEVIAVRGSASSLSGLAGRIGGARGVLAAELTIAAVDEPAL